MSKAWDAIIIGGGAAGLFCAGVAGQLGKRVLVLDHADILCEKIRISGGGRCKKLASVGVKTLRNNDILPFQLVTDKLR